MLELIARIVAGIGVGILVISSIYYWVRSGFLVPKLMHYLAILMVLIAIAMSYFSYSANDPTLPKVLYSIPMFPAIVYLGYILLGGGFQSMRMKKQSREKPVKENIEFEKLVDEITREEFGDEEAEEIEIVEVKKIEGKIHEGLFGESPSIAYVNCMVLKMIKKNIDEVILAEKDDLMGLLGKEECIGNEEVFRILPEYRKIVNRIKVLSGLNPVRYKEEKMGKFNVKTDGQDYKIETTIGVKDSYVKIVKQNADLGN